VSPVEELKEFGNCNGINNHQKSYNKSVAEQEFIPGDNDKRNKG
jgi:hypothetical protein